MRLHKHQGDEKTTGQHLWEQGTEDEGNLQDFESRLKLE
jgi:hypothetical protein